MNRNSNRGFASMTDERRRELARKGGLAVSAQPGHMQKIGRRGGLKTQKRRREMNAHKYHPAL